MSRLNGAVRTLAILALVLVTGAFAAPTLVATITLAHEAGPGAVVPSHNLIYVSEGSGNRISIIDGATNAVVRVTSSPSGFHWSAASNPTTGRVYISQQFAQKLLVLEGATGDAIEEITVPSVVQTIEDVIVNPTTNEIFVVRGNNEDIAVLNGNGLNPHALLRSFSHHMSAGVQLALDPGHNWLFTASSSSNQIRVFFASSGSHQMFQEMPPVSGIARHSNDLALDPVHNRLY